MNYIKQLDSCRCCPRKCMINRNNHELGYCKVDNNIYISKYMLHMWEEPCISGKNGSGAVFFTSCQLNCKFCQNYKISQEGIGRTITINELSDIFLKLQKMGANNINLVSPTIYVYQIKEALILAKRKGLSIPIVYNTSRI